MCAQGRAVWSAPETTLRSGVKKTQKKPLSKSADTTNALGRKEEKSIMKNEEEKGRLKETQKHGSVEGNGYCLVTLSEISSLIYTNKQKDCVTIAGQKLNQGLPRPIAEVLIMLLPELTEGSTQYQIWLSAAASATLKNQTNSAHLIAAAPELLDALEAMIEITDRKHDVWDNAKAKGEAKGEAGSE